MLNLEGEVYSGEACDRSGAELFLQYFKAQKFLLSKSYPMGKCSE